MPTLATWAGGRARSFSRGTSMLTTLETMTCFLKEERLLPARVVHAAGTPSPSQ